MNTSTKAAHHVTAGDTVTARTTGRTFTVTSVNQVGLYFELISADGIEARARFDTQLAVN